MTTQDPRIPVSQDAESEPRFIRSAQTVVDVLGECAAEVERLTQADRQWADHVKRLADERDRMETWARAEQAERFKAEEQRTDERSEVERQRAALQEIYGHATADNDGQPCCDTVVMLAKAALVRRSV